MVHYLSNTYYFYYMPKRPKNMNDYLAGLQFISGPIKTVEDFWGFYSHMIRPVDEFSSLSDIYLFKEGLRPVWEDKENKKGGKFVVKTRRNYTSKWWEDLLLAFIGDQIDGCESINGIVISFRANDNNLIGIWNNNSEDIERLSFSLKQLFKIEKLDYKPHFNRIDRLLKDGLGGSEGSTDGTTTLNSSIDSGMDYFRSYQQPSLNSSGNSINGSGGGTGGTSSNIKLNTSGSNISTSPLNSFMQTQNIDFNYLQQMQQQYMQHMQQQQAAAQGQQQQQQQQQGGQQQGQGQGGQPSNIFQFQV